MLRRIPARPENAGSYAMDRILERTSPKHDTVFVNYVKLCENSYLNFKLFTFDYQRIIIPFEFQSILKNEIHIVKNIVVYRPSNQY